jgi:nucleoside-diphosphate-sugar epimerase
MDKEKVLVTGGSGFLGQYLVRKLREQHKEVYILDLLAPEVKGDVFIQGDIRNIDVCMKATAGVSVVYHNVAQVPLAKNRELFESVNILGTRNILEASAINQVNSFVYTSSSAVFGLPKDMPANSDSSLKPIEEYGRTKLKGEILVEEYRDRIANTSIVRPRTILGSGRLGLFSVLFDWVSEGLDIFVFDGGQNAYQFIHAADLTDGIIAAGVMQGHNKFNLGAIEYNTLRADLEDLCRHAGTGSQVRSLPGWLVRKPLLLGSRMKLIPFASYQLLLYSQAMYFDSEDDWRTLEVKPTFSNSKALVESYEWFIQNRELFKSAVKKSVHRSMANGKSLDLIKYGLKLIKTH